MTKKASDGFLDGLANEATEQLESIRSYRTYQGTDPDRWKRAKLAIGVIGAYVRLRATTANERSNDLIERRLGFAEGADDRQITSGE